MRDNLRTLDRWLAHLSLDRVNVEEQVVAFVSLPSAFWLLGLAADLDERTPSELGRDPLDSPWVPRRLSTFE
jgi:hypothetical protein